jgi:protein-tyrosine phosphatase
MQTHIHKEDVKLDYNYITDGIYIGTNQCCMTGLVDVLKKEDISADISLEEEKLDQPFGVDVYVWLPVADNLAPTDEQLSFGAESLQQLVAQKRKIYVHCKNGHGRAPTLVAGYLIKNGQTPTEAVTFIVSKRSGVHLHPPQAEALEKYAQMAR